MLTSTFLLITFHVCLAIAYVPKSELGNAFIQFYYVLPNSLPKFCTNLYKQQHVNESCRYFRFLSELDIVSLFFSFKPLLKMCSWVSLWFQFALPWKLMESSTFSYVYWTFEYLLLWNILCSFGLTGFPYWFDGVLYTLWIWILCHWIQCVL